jgi:hypothetical protein
MRTPNGGSRSKRSSNDCNVVRCRTLETRWKPEDLPVRGDIYLHFHRDADERAGVLVQLVGGWTLAPVSVVNSVRLHRAVDGAFEDGRPGGRVG